MPQHDHQHVALAGHVVDALRLPAAFRQTKLIEVLDFARDMTLPGVFPLFARLVDAMGKRKQGAEESKSNDTPRRGRRRG